MNNLPISDEGLSTLEEVEGCSLNPFFDYKGYSIGYGHLIKPEEKYLMNGITQEVATQLLIADVYVACSLLKSRITAWDSMPQNKKDACIIMCFNVPAAFFSGSIDDKINANAPLDVLEHTWKSYNKVRVKGVLEENKGLTERRNKEWDLYSKTIA